MSIATVNPYTNQTEKIFEEYSEDKISRMLLATETAFTKWRKTTFAERAPIMQAAGKVLREQKEKWATLMTTEMGKPITQSRAEVDKCANLCDYYAENAERFLRDEPKETDAKRSFVSFEPIGTVLAIMPWNFPMWQVFRFACPAIMAGNTGLLKHASNVPQTALAIVEVFKEAGLPDGVFDTLLISGSKASELIQLPTIKAATITGSEYAGSQVAKYAGESLKKSVLELGGSDPFVVLEDANIDKAAKNAAHSRLINSGQSCIAAKRFIVVESIADAFQEKFLHYLKEKKMGNPMEEDTEVGPMARQDLADEIEKQTKESVDAGAELLLGGSQPEHEGTFMDITLIKNPPKGSPAHDDEIFGPVASLFVEKDEKAAIAKANDSPFGLGASLWTQDHEKADRLAREIEAGCVFVNQFVKSDQRVPFGGIKRSGYGRELSDYGIKEFVNIKTIWIED